MDLYVKQVPGKGRGVFCHRWISKEETIEYSDVIVLEQNDIGHIENTILNQYIFSWPDGKAAIGLGLLSLYNHDEHPNAQFLVVAPENAIMIKAIKNIPQDTEIVVDYGNKERFRFIK